MSSSMAKSNKFVSWILGLLLLVAIVVWVSVAEAPDKNLHIYFLNVGQGDSIYVRTMSNVDLLIDGGPDDTVLSELGEVMPFYDHKIDYLLLTHPHSDHLSGLIEVLKRYEVGEIIATDATHTTSEYLEWLKLIRDKKIPYKLARSGEEINLDNDVNLDILWPIESYENNKIDNLNNTSIVAKLVYAKFSALFMGDAEVEVQQQLLKTDSRKLKTNILKVPHHGSSNASNIDFLKAVLPSAAIISVGENNQFGHPHASALTTLESINAAIYRTDRDGRVEVVSDGKSFWTKTSE